jgi:DHA1 family tetracycline resistance protein-like MFS transporter
MATAAANVDTLEEQKKDEVAHRLYYGFGIFMCAVTMVVPVRAPMVLNIKKGDAAATAKAMGSMSAVAAVIELIINPVIGKMSDQYGRRPFLIFSALVNAILHGLVSVMPGNLAMQFVDRMISGAMIFGYLAPTQAALADMYAKNPQKLGMTIASAMQYFGVGAALGPFIGSKLGGAKAFFVSAAMFVASAVYVNGSIEETLAQKDRKEFKMSDINPLAFFKLFQDKTLGWLTITGGLQSFGDYVNIYDINNLFMIKVLGYGPPQIGNFAMTVGLTQIMGGNISGKVIKALGLKSTLLFSNFMWILGMAMMGTAKNSKQAFAALMIWTFGHNRNAPVSALLQKYGQTQGMGRGAIIAADGNFKAYIKVMIPLLYSNLFAWATSGGRNLPGLPYFVICGLTMLSQATFQIADTTE